MRRLTAIPEDLFVSHGQVVEALFQQAVQRALWRHKRLGNPVAAWENDQVVIVRPEEIGIDESLLTDKLHGFETER